MRTSIKLLTAAVMGTACCGSALAYGPAIAPDFTFYVGSGSAQGAAIAAFAQSLMQADGNLDYYTDDATSCKKGANYYAIYGTWKTTQGGIAAGKKVLIMAANNGGTFKNGIDGVARSHAIDYQTFLGNATNTGCAAPGGGLPAPYTGLANYKVITAATKENHIPMVGLSDEEMGLFVGINLPTSAPNTPLSAADFNNTQRTALYENVFGVAINNLLAADMTAKWGNNNISDAQVTAIYSGTYSDYSQLCQEQGNPPVEKCLTAGPITLQSRAPGSGSKAAWNQYFLDNPGMTYFIPSTQGGTGNSLTPVDQNGSFGDCTAYSSASYNVCQQSSNGNVQKGLNTANTNGTRAFGLLGLEFQPGAGDTYGFAALNGAVIDGTTTKTCGNAIADAFEPARVVNGEHRLYYTNSLNIRIKSVGGAPFLGDGSTASDFMTAFKTAASNPVLQVSVPGVLLDPSVTTV
ncbi:MAG TPA: hypothetical protein VLV29_09170, partial [Steroidobacteraceae bacterium]|nr:hypothetical protein [Steroidobacteraceae bacterium]